MKKLFLLLILGITLNAESISLQLGWNLIGSSSKINISNFSQYGIDEVFMYVNGGWKNYKKSSNINNIGSAIEKNNGFWIYSTANTTLNFAFNNTYSISLESLAGTYKILSSNLTSSLIQSYFFSESDLSGSTHTMNSNGTYATKTYYKENLIQSTNGTFSILDGKIISYDNATGNDSISKLIVSGNMVTLSSKNSIFTATTIFQKIN